MTAPQDTSTAQTHSAKVDATSGLRFIASLKSLLFFACLWWLLTEGEVSSWVIGIIVVPFAAWLSLTLFKDYGLTDSDPAHAVNKTQSIRVSRLFHFLPFFLLQSIVGGWQTAKLAIRPSMPINPGFFRYNIRLQGSSARLFFMHLVSLLPGTVSAKLEGDQLLIHALEVSPQNSSDIKICEQQVASLFSGESIELMAHTNNSED